jgi:hypothetical protein
VTANDAGNKTLLVRLSAASAGHAMAAIFAEFAARAAWCCDPRGLRVARAVALTGTAGIPRNRFNFGVPPQSTMKRVAPVFVEERWGSAPSLT